MANILNASMFVHETYTECKKVKMYSLSKHEYIVKSTLFYKDRRPFCEIKCSVTVFGLFVKSSIAYIVQNFSEN